MRLLLFEFVSVPHVCSRYVCMYVPGIYNYMYHPWYVCANSNTTRINNNDVTSFISPSRCIYLSVVAGHGLQ